MVAEKTRAEGVEATLDSDIQTEAAARAAQDDVIEASLGLHQMDLSMAICLTVRGIFDYNMMILPTSKAAY